MCSLVYSSILKLVSSWPRSPGRVQVLKPVLESRLKFLASEQSFLLKVDQERNRVFLGFPLTSLFTGDVGNRVTKVIQVYPGLSWF